MATSSITANIEIKDPAAARAFVEALLSTEPWPQPKPTVCASYFASDATHLATTIDLSERTTTFDVAFGGGLAFAPGSVVTVRLGTRRPKGEARKLLAWSARPEGVKFVLCEENLGGVIAGEDGLYLISGMTIILR